MSLCWEYTCKKCGKAFDTMHPDPTRICGSCWRKLTEEARQAILPGATPIATTPTNEPKMPEVIYADNKREAPNLRHCYHRQMDGTTTYHHDDKVQELKTEVENVLVKNLELKMALNKLVLALEVLKTFHRHSPVWTEFNITERLTKASNLLK